MCKKNVLLFLMFCFMPLIAREFSINGGINFNYARYKLDSIAPQSGYLAGPHFDFAYKRPGSIYTGVAFDARWNAGLICSSNDLCNTNCLVGGCLNADIADYFVDWRIGYHYVSDSDLFTVTPFVGFGFQHASHQIEPNILRYKYYQMYVPIGLDFLYHSPRNFSIGFQALYRSGVYNRLGITTPCVEDDCNSECGDKIKLKYSHGFFLGAPVIFNYRQQERIGFHLSCIPFFDWNRFADTCDTNSVGVVFPILRNKRWNLGARVLLGITF